MTQLDSVWVVSEDASSYAGLVLLARELGASVSAVWMGDSATCAEVLTCGADSIVHVKTGALVEDGIAEMERLVAERKPEVVLAQPSKRMRLVAASVAARLGTCVISDASQLWIDASGAVCVERMVYGGGGVSRERACSAPAVVVVGAALLARAVADAAEVSVSALAPDAVESVAGLMGSSGLSLVGRRIREMETVNLAAARNIVSAGRGFAAQEDLNLAMELAQAIGAEVGCTRPVAEGTKWMARERYIGVSGVMLSPNLFVAVGVSGQVQHMVGAADAKTIVAINKDKNAPVFKQADYGIVGDLYEVIPLLVAELE